jgi:hypothetical protein
VYTTRLLLVLMLTLGITAEAQTSRRSKAKPKPKKPAVTKPVPAPEESGPEAPGTSAEPASESASKPSPAKPVAPALARPDAPVLPVASDNTVVFAIPRTANAEPAAARLQAELTRLLGSKPDVRLVNLDALFPAPEPASTKEADALYEEGKEAYDNLDPEAAAGKFSAAAEAYEKHPGSMKPQRLAKTFIFLGASQLLNGDKDSAKSAFLRALAAHPGTQPEQGLFDSSVHTSFTDAQQQFNSQKPGSLDIDSKPSGARVTVGGEDMGVTPLKNVPVHPGRHPVLLSLPGHVPYASYPQVASGKTAEVKPQLEPLPAMAEAIATASRAASEKSFDSSKMPPELTALADKLGARYVVLAAVQQKKSNPAEAEVQVWDVRTKNRLRGVELELQSKDPERSTVAAADRVHGFLTGRMMAEPISDSKMPQVVKKPWFWAAVVGGAAVVTGGILYATQDKKGGPLGPVTGLPGLGF